MNDQFDPAQQSPVPENAPARRRRTEYRAAERAAIAREGEAGIFDTPPLDLSGMAVQPAPKEQTITATRTNTVRSGMPSQGVPSPNAPQDRALNRPQNVPVVRRPVPAPEYAPVQQLGNAPVRQPVRRSVPPVSPAPANEPEEERGVSGGLIALMLMLLVIAALVIGLIMVPEDDTSFLGDIKRGVTAPIAALFGGDDDDAAAPTAIDNSFTAAVVQNTAPYKVMFSLVTSEGVTAVRVVDETGAVIPTATTMSSPNTQSTIVWMFEMTLEAGYEGTVQAQIQTPEGWVDTGLKQALSIGKAAAATISRMPAATNPAATASQPTNVPTPTPTPTPKISVPPATDAPALVITNETDTPDAQDVTPTPTLSVTATPTLVPTNSPEPTGEPTPEPTEEPTPTPTATPTPEPAATPKLDAQAVKSADPALISVSTIWSDGKKVNTYNRAKPINMPEGDAYLTYDFGVTTFRQNAFRQNAASGTVNDPTSMKLLWTAEAGSAQGQSRNYYGIVWTGQPLITKWSKNIRTSLNISDELKDGVLKEVIVAGYDGKIYFLNLEDGTPTREVIDLGYPMRSTPSLDPLGFPVMTVGQYAMRMKSGTGKNIGLYYYNLLNQEQERLIDGLDKKAERLYYEVGAFDTSALIDRNTKTLIGVGTNGMLYTETLDTKLHLQDDGTYKLQFNDPVQVSMLSRTKNQKASYTAVESSLAMYGSYAFYADMDGILRCVDTTTMTTSWAVDTGDAVRAAIALDLDEDTRTLWLYTANTVRNGRTRGDVTIRRFNAMTGEEDWAYALQCAEGKKKDVTFGDYVVPGAIASPVIGQEGLSDLVYFTLSSVSTTGARKLVGNDTEAAMSGVLIALNKQTGRVAWYKEMDAYCYSSPVAVYAEDGQGWIIQACSNGTLCLLDGLTGETINTLQVNGVIEGSPAVYYNTLVIGTTGKDTTYIYGIELN